MNERQKRLLGILACQVNGKVVTSADLASKFVVTTRTIKNDMVVISQALIGKGAHIVGKRNKGYYLQVDDKTSFSSFLLKYNLQSDIANIQKVDKIELGIIIARNMIASANGVRIDDLAEKINYNRSYVSSIIKWCDAFYSSFRLKMKSSSNIGKLVVGQEHHLRLAMVELLAAHYHEININDSNACEEFSNLFACQQQERKDVRHCFLKCLRESAYALRDSNTQRGAMYLILAYNRYCSGKKIVLPQRWIDEVKELEIHQLTLQIFNQLPNKYQELLKDENEMAFFTIFLLTCLDVKIGCYNQEICGLIEDELVLCQRALQQVLEPYGIDLDRWQQQVLENILVPIIYACRYQLDGLEKMNYRNEGVFLSSPISVFLAYQMAEALNQKIAYRSCPTDIAIFSAFIQNILASVSYPIKKLRLLSTPTFGPALGYLFDQKLIQRYPELIESIDAIELYEYRRIQDQQYDGFIVDLFFPDEQQYDSTGYNYDLPVVPSFQRTWKNIESKVFDSLLINAYQYRDYLPQQSQIRVIEDYRFGSIELLFQTMALMHGKNYESAKWLWQSFEKRECQKTMVIHGCVVICAESQYCKEQVLELYCLNNPALWQEKKFNYIIFCSLALDNIYKVKLVETTLRDIIAENEFSLFKKDGISCIEHMVRSNLRHVTQ